MKIEVSSHLSDIDIVSRVRNGSILVENLRFRASDLWAKGGSTPLLVEEGKFYCPVCFSRLPAGYRLVEEGCFFACDHCIPFLES